MVQYLVKSVSHPPTERISQLEISATAVSVCDVALGIKPWIQGCFIIRPSNKNLQKKEMILPKATNASVTKQPVPP